MKNFVYLLIFSIFISSCTSIPLSTNSSRYPAAISKYQNECAIAVSEIFNQRQYKSSFDNLTKIEKELQELPKNIGTPREQLVASIDELSNTNEELAVLVREALTTQDNLGAKELLIDTSTLPSKMSNFVNGTYKKIVGKRGVSKPFMRFEVINDNTLLIHHLEDKFPMIVRWDDIVNPSVDLVNKVELGKVTLGDFNKFEQFQVLSIPKSFTSNDSLSNFDKYVYSLISGSRVNKHIHSEKSLVMKIASLLHDKTLIHDRPTQKEFNAVRKLLDTDIDFRKKVKSLLFIAPTATGKTRIIGNNVVNKVSFINQKLVSMPSYKQKLSVVMANTPDLVNQLAKDLGEQLNSEVHSQNFRIIQWGGLNSEKMSAKELQNFIDKSEVPVVLVTSTHTIASRMRSNELIEELFTRANSISVDEAHNSSSNTFKRVMSVGLDVANRQREGSNVLDSLDILGVTASPITRHERTVELFERSYWASIDKPKDFAYRVKTFTGKISSTTNDILEWVRIQKQFKNAKERGEITAPDTPMYYKPKDFGHTFDTLFKRKGSGTHSYVNLRRLKNVWKEINPLIDNHGPGVIHAYPRDAANIAQTLSELTGKNYVSLTKLSAKKTNAVLQAFKNKTLYDGKNVDAIVGQIKEGLDFPHAGWYLSFKRYVRFPENIQGMGRVVRLNLDKATPRIIYFGDNVDSIAFRDVKELILRKMGRLPRKLQSGRGFSGARNPIRHHPDSTLGKLMPDLNTAMEIVFRQNYKLSREFSLAKKVTPEMIESFVKILNKTIKSQKNIEIGNVLKSLVSEVNTFSFFKGNLKDTWKFCDHILKVAKKGKPYPKTLSKEELYILSSKSEMSQVAEFRAMKSWIGGSGRTALEQLELNPRGVYDFAEVINSLVAKNPDMLLKDFKNQKLNKQFKDLIATTSETLWDRLSYSSRIVFEQLFVEGKIVPIESTIDDFIASNDALPRFYYHKLEKGLDVTIDDKISHKLAQRLEAYIHSGKLNFNNLSKDSANFILNSKFFKKIIFQAIQALENELSKIPSHLKVKITYNDLLKHQSFGSFRILEKFAQDGNVEALALKDAINQILN